jgi:hypothetical protein
MLLEPAPGMLLDPAPGVTELVPAPLAKPVSGWEQLVASTNVESPTIPIMKAGRVSEVPWVMGIRGMRGAGATAID